MENSYRTPGWLSGLLIVLGLATPATLGLFLYRHAELANLEEERLQIDLGQADRNTRLTQSAALASPLDQTIAVRKEQIRALTENDGTYRGDVDRLLQQGAAARAAGSDSQKKEIDLYLDQMKEMAERRADLGKEEERAFTSEREKEEALRKLREEVERESQALEKTRKAALNVNTGLEARIAELAGRVRQLTNQIDISNRALVPDGAILASQARDGYVVIDRGSRQNLRKDLRFSVFSRRAGRISFKGAIQVMSVDERTAVCRVLAENDPNDPIIVGDLIHNPVYDPDRVRGFTIRGGFRRFSKSELASFIIDAGGRVDPSLSVDTDYLVAGEGVPKDIELAGKLGVSIINEDQLLDYVRPGDGPRPSTWDFIVRAAGEGRTFGIAGSFDRARADRIEAAIKRAGGKVSGGVSRGYAALIAGRGAEKAMAEARELGVPVIDQAQFADIADLDAVEKGK